MGIRRPDNFDQFCSCIFDPVFNHKYDHKPIPEKRRQVEFLKGFN